MENYDPNGWDHNHTQPQSHQFSQNVQWQNHLSHNASWNNVNEAGRYIHHDYRGSTSDYNQTPRIGECSPNFAWQPLQYCNNQFSHNAGWNNVNEASRYIHHDYRGSTSDYNQTPRIGECSSNFARQPLQYCNNQFSHNSGWNNLNEAYRPYDYTQNYASWNHGNVGNFVRYPYNDYRESNSDYSQTQSNFGSNFEWQPPQDCSNQFPHLNKDYRQNEYTLNHQGSSEWSHNEERPTQSQNLSQSNSALNGKLLLSDKSFSTTSVSSTRVTSPQNVAPTEVPDDRAVLQDAIKSLTIQPNNELGCDISDMYMMTSDQSPKRLCCPFCKKLFIKLAKHMEDKHSEEADVKKFMDLPKGSKARRAIQDSLRKIGQFNFNKNAKLNNKQLIPSRRPNANHKRKAADEISCPYCYGSYSKSGINFHIKKNCLQKPKEDERTEGERVVSSLASSVERRYHENACPALQAVFDKCHNDHIIRCIRFDWLATVYGNKLTAKYNKPRHKKMIQNRMRLIGRVLHALKEIEPEVTELANLFVPKHYDRVVDAIKAVARVDEVRNEFIAPATASSAVTAIRQISEMLIVEYIKKDDRENQRITRDFSAVMNSDMHISINKMVNETQSRMARQRTVILPSSHDVNCLSKYLESERTACFYELSQSYSFKNWKRLNELTMISIIVYNRRRVGDTQNILDEDFACKEVINETNELLTTLPEHSKQIAQQFSRMKVRGKKNRTVPVLLKVDVSECLNLLLSHREKAGVSTLNNFLFGLPSNKDVYQVVDAGRVLKKFAVASGAKDPSLITATNLRKHLATICVTMQLNDTSVADVAEFMGHAEKVHREHYRQNPIERQIVEMSKVLEAAQGNLIAKNQDEIHSTDVDFNKGRKRKLPSADSKGKRNPRRASKKTK